LFNANIFVFADNFFLTIVLLAWVGLSACASRLLHKCHENGTICVLKLVVADCCLVGWAKKKSWKKGVFNPGKLHKNRFKNEFRWLPLATTVQPHDKGHQKVNIHKIGVTAVMNCLLSLGW